MAPPSRSCWAAVVMASLASGASAHAAELTASGPDECADADELEFRVERRIGTALAATDALHFDVSMDRSSAGHRARIDVRVDGSTEVAMQRVLVASDCEKLADAVSVAVALALGATRADADHAASQGVPRGASRSPVAMPDGTAIDGRVGDVSGPRAAADGATPPSPRGAGAPLDRRATEPRSEAALVPALSVWLLGDVGSLPSPTAGMALGAEAGWRRFELRVVGTVLFAREASAAGASEPGQGATLDLMTAALSGCAAPFGDLRAAFAPTLCLGMEVGRLAGVGTGIDFPRRGSALWAAPVAQAGVAWRIPRTSLRLSSIVLAAAPLNRDEFALGGIGTVHQPPPVIGRAALGLGMQFD